MQIDFRHQESRHLSELKDPFKSSKITKIFMWIFPADGYWRKQTEFNAHIEFKNDNTEGRQVIEASDFSTLVKKVEDFINSLEKQ